MIIAHDSVSLYISALMRTSPTSMLPFASQSTGTTCCIAAQPVATQRNPLHRSTHSRGTHSVLAAYSQGGGAFTSLRAGHSTACTFMPHIAAEAGLVPCAETGMMHTSLPPAKRESVRHARSRQRNYE